jgi:bifunctional non-homologous end joining protein LigD
MGLTLYNKKRSFLRTPEPKGKTHSRGKSLVFCVQKHHATALHYDFRLEMDGVLKSWAVPKGPSLNPADKHLAMMVEDHPYDYRTFEGIIPEGNYGAGSVIVWDEGTYEPLELTPAGMSDDEFLLDQVDRGSVKIVMHGTKLKGEFALVRFKRAGEHAWLLIKHKDEYASTKDVTWQDRSVRTGLSLEEVAEGKGATRAQRSAARNKERAAEAAVRKKERAHEHEIEQEARKAGEKHPMPSEVSPMLAEQGEFPFDHPEYIFEFKWDGYRAIAEVLAGKRKKRGTVRLTSRNGLDFAKKYVPVAEALADLPHDAVLDGEIVVLDKQGRSRFHLLQDYTRAQSKGDAGALMYYVFDLLWLDGYDLRGLPLTKRKLLLKELLHENDTVKYSDHIEEHGLKLYALAKRKGYEGIMAKKKNSAYRENRSADWLKIKHVQTQEAVIAGFTAPRGKREEFGALILGVYDNNELRYVGHAGGGFDAKNLRAVHALLKPLVTKTSAFAKDPPTNMPVTWVQPELVCQVKFTEWTRDGVMRHPIFLGMREDMSPRDVADKEHMTARGNAGNSPGTRTYSTASAAGNGKAQLTNLNKIYWPDEGYTKGDLIAYYDRIAEYILPCLKNRPISLNRYPDGIEGESFFQKDLVHKPEWVKTVPIFSEHDQRDLQWLICNDRDTLLYIANLGSIEINPWNSTYKKPDHPDYMIIDLDPEGIPFTEVIRAAKTVKELLDSADVDSFLKTSGKTGLHIMVPLRAKYTYEQSKQFAQIVANTVFSELPETTSVVRDPNKRQHRIYLDFLQNREGQTIAAPYCVRPVAGAPVSAPLRWSELTSSLSPADYTIKTIFRRLARTGDLWEEFRKHPGIDMKRSLKKLSVMSS